MKFELITPTKKIKVMEFFPFIPGRPEWASVPFAQVREFSPNHTGFIGHAAGSFYFQEDGNPTLVKVTN